MLKDKVLSRKSPLRLYGFSPPKAGNPPEKNREIAARQVERVNALGADGAIVYDLQDEPGRDGTARPFPFLPTLDPLEYACDFLVGMKAPCIIYRCVAKDTAETFSAWVGRLAGRGDDLAVFVGAPTSDGPPGRLGLKAACNIARALHPDMCFGGVGIAERHLKKSDEDKRLLSKHREGCAFFISQTVYDVQATKSLISDYALRFAGAGIATPPLVFSFAPCGSLKTMEFMKWLGISFPRWMENELRHSRDVLARSLDLCTEIAEELASFACAKGVPTGMNVESISIRKEEIEASLVLYRALAERAFT